MEKITVWVRDLTYDDCIDTQLKLPMETKQLWGKLNKEHEYIVIESEVLNVDEFECINHLNDFLIGCEQNGISKEDLEVLSATYLYNEVIEMINDGTFCIIDFDAETESWYGGTGGSFSSTHDRGMCLYDSEMYSPFNFEMTEDIYPWINWCDVWESVNTEGWRAVWVDRRHYLVHR